MRRDSPHAGKALLDQALGGGDKIGKSVGLLLAPPFPVPAIAAFLTAAHMGNCVMKAAVD